MHSGVEAGVGIIFLIISLIIVHFAPRNRGFLSILLINASVESQL